MGGGGSPEGVGLPGHPFYNPRSSAFGAPLIHIADFALGPFVEALVTTYQGSPESGLSLVGAVAPGSGSLTSCDFPCINFPL